MKEVRIGIVGIGNMGRGHYRMIKEDVKNLTCTAIADIDPEQLKWAEENIKEDVKLFSSADEMMDSGLCDAVLIAVPHYDHPSIAISAFKKGLHVFNEKPAAVYTKQVNEMIDAYKEYGEPKNLVFSMGFNQRCRPCFQTVRKLVQSGELGNIKKVIWIATDWYRPQCYHDSGSWRSTWKGEGGGTIINQNPHNIDLFQWMFGMPSQILSINDYGKYYNIEVEDDVTAFFKYDNGMVGIYTTSTGEAPGTNRLEISCDMGKIVCEFNKVTFYRNTVSERFHNANNSSAFGRPETWTCDIPVVNPPIDEHAVLLQNFTDAITNGTKLIAPGVEGINEMTMSNAIYYSDWKGNTWIDLKNFDHEGFYNALMEKIKNSTYKKPEVKKQTSDLKGSY